MSHEFIILNNGVIEKYNDFDDIPESFDNLIKFNPEVIPPPHTEEEHELNAQWETKFKELIKRETR